MEGARARVLKPYLDDMEVIPLLEKEDEIELARRIEAGGPDAELAKIELIRANLRLVFSIARQFFSGKIPLSDLVQEGNLGLIKAVEKFDYTKGFRFATYATWWIRQAIISFIQCFSKPIRIPVYKYELIGKVRQAEIFLFRLLGREPTLSEIAHMLEIDDVAKLQALMSLARWQHVSLEAPASDGSDSRVEDFIQDPDSEPFDVEVERAEVPGEIGELLSKVTPREEKVIRMRYAIGEPCLYSLEEIGARLHLTRERIRQIEIMAMCKLRRAQRRRMLDGSLT